MNNDIFYKGNTIIWQKDCDWAEKLLHVCGSAIANLPSRIEEGNIEVRHQHYGEKAKSIFSAELISGASSYWLMHYELTSKDIVHEALRGLNSLEWDSNYSGDKWTSGIFAEQILARLGDADKQSNLPPSGVYHYGDFVAMVMNGSNQRFMASVSFANEAPHRIRECDLMLHTIATALNHIFFNDNDTTLRDSYDVVRKDLVDYAKLMRWSRNSLNKMTALVSSELNHPAMVH